jgi:peptidoglycan hydrolase-like protein with peptidoglycan-binding domain
MAAINATETPVELRWNGEATPSMTRSSYFEVEMGFEESSPGEASPSSSAEAVMEALEAAGLGEDNEFQVAPEGLAAEAPETHETLQERLPEDHFAPIASQEWPSEDHFTSVASEAEALLERFFERIQGYEGEALTEAEIERVIAEIAPPHDPFAPASEQFLGGLIRSVGNFVSNTVKTVTRTARSAAHAIADVSSSVADTLGKVPILGSGLKGLYGYTYGALIQAADNVVSGVRLDKVASRYLESQVQNVREVAPYVQAVISLVPGIGPGVSGAISAGLSLAQGRSIDQALVDAAVGALPGGALVQSAAKMTYAAASGKPISDIAVAALPLSPAAKEGLKAGLRVASDLAQGKRVDKTLLAEANRQVERLPPQFRTAAQVGIALGQGKRLQDVAATQLPRLIAVGGPLAAAGQKIASQSPVVQRARRLLAREGQHGFDVAQGLMAHSGASVHQVERARAALRGEALKGFERAVALHGGYALPKARVVPPASPVKGTPAPAPARIGTLGRAITARAPGVRASGPSAPTPLIRRPEVVAAVQPLPASSVSDGGPAVPLDEPASMPSDEPAVVPSDRPTAIPTSDVTTSSAATCPSCGAPQVADASDSGSDSDSEPADGAVTSAKPVDDVSLASTPTLGELETPFELSWMAEPPASEMHPPDSFEFEGPFELGEVARPSLARSTPQYVRWVQDTLNHTLGTKLTVDGRGGPATRAAVAQFQRLHQLNPDGVVGPATEAILASTSAVPAPAIAGGTSSAADSRARYANWSDADDRRKGRNPRDQGTVAAGPQGASKVLEFPVPRDRSRRIFLLHNFKIDGASLQPEHKQYIEGLAKWMRSGPGGGWQVFAEAHASRTGAARHDDLLSEDRYLVTRAFLESQLLRAGVDAARLRIYGEGVGFRHSPLPGEDPRARSVYVVVQPDPSPSPPLAWPPPIAPVSWPPANPPPKPGPKPPPLPFRTTPSPRVLVKIVDAIALNLEQGATLTLDQLAATAGELGVGPAVEAVRGAAPEIVFARAFDSLTSAEIQTLVTDARKQDPTYEPFNFDNALEIVLDIGFDTSALEAALDNWAGVVEFAYTGADATDPLVTAKSNPLFKMQRYFNAAPVGIDAPAAWAKGADGTGTNIIDLEQGWFLNHVDLPTGITLLAGTNSRESFYHGAAVLGMIVGRDDTFGIVGAAPKANARVISYFDPPGKSRANLVKRVEDRVLKANAALSSGDVLLLEAQFVGSIGKIKTLLPVEVEPLVLKAIQNATARGVIVVEAAANGGNYPNARTKKVDHHGTDLDTFVDKAGKKVLSRSTPADFKDSGAIMVTGSVSAVPHAPHTLLNFGSRIDCYGWGADIVTCNWDPHLPTARDAYMGIGLYFKESFGGTSGACPMIAGCCLLMQHLQALLKPKGRPPGKVASAAMRSILSKESNGTASARATDKIGVMPDFAKIIVNEFLP